MKVIIAAAQTGGHINPGIAIANKIKEKKNQVVFLSKIIQLVQNSKKLEEMFYIDEEKFHQEFLMMMED